MTVAPSGGYSALVYIDNFTQTALGGNAAASTLFINSEQAGLSASMNQSGSTLVTATEIIGYWGTGSFSQSGGSHTVTNALYVGGYGPSRGSYNLTGGNLTASSEALGYAAASTGTFTQSGGSNTVSGSLALTLYGAGEGAYTLSGGILNVGGAITTGNGIGTLNLNGGVLTVGSGNIGLSNLSLGSVAGSSGSYVQTKGTVTVSNLVLGIAGSDASYTLAGGALNIGTSAAGGGQSILNLDGGSFSALGSVSLVNVVLGSSAGSAFTLNLGNGGGGASTFAAASETIGDLGAGHVVQIGGSNTVGTLKINDTYTYSGGTLVVTGSLTNNGVLEVGGTTLQYGSSALNTGTVSGHGLLTGGGFTNDNLVSQSGGHLTLAGLGSYANNGNWDVLNGYQLRLAGTAFSNAGNLNLNGGSVTGAGSLDNTAEGTISGRGVIGTSFSNAGRLALTDGTTTVIQAFVNSGVIQLRSNTASLAGGLITNTGLIQGYGKVASAVTNTGSIQASGGALAFTKVVSNSGNLVADSASTLLFQTGGLTANSGSIRINGGALNNTGHTLDNSGQIQVSTGVGQIYGGVTGLAGSQLIVSGGGSLTLYDTVDIQSGAELRVAAGSSATFFGQVYQRTGSVFSGTGMKNYEGGYSPGSSPGFAVDGGNVNFGAGNVFLVEIGGTSACTADCATNDALKNSSFDKYVVAGNLALGGTLKLVSWNGFVLQAGTSYDLLDWGSVSGSFASVDTSGLLLPAGLVLDTSQLTTGGSFSVTAVPEPGTWATMLGGLSALGLLRRRRGAQSAMSA